MSPRSDRGVSLTPVVEFEPGRFATRSLKTPSAPGRDDPLGWDSYWRESLEDAGIDELQPVRPASWFVPITQLTRPNTIRRLLEVELGGAQSLDELGPFLGGYVLEADGKRIEPGCCGDLGNLADWREAAAWRSGAWKMIWIGHPWTHVSAEGDTLTFLEPTDEDPPVTRTPCLTVHRAQLVEAIEEADRLVRELAGRLSPLVQELDLELSPEDAVHVLTRGH